MQRKRVNVTPKGSDYFTSDAKKLDFINSGCVLLDCTLGGGWPLGRICNIVGDKAVGKTLLAIEAATNFRIKYPKGHIWYREAEAAFDDGYAAALGLPVESVDFGPDGLGTAWETVEDIFEDLNRCIAQAKKSGQPGLYVIDSLDALSSRAELGRDIDEGSYGMEKQKQLGQLFRRLTRGLKEANILLVIISQIRDKIGVMGFGPKHRRSGGRALDFYASIIIYLSHLKTLTKTVSGVKRATAVEVKAKCEKNKIGLPYRDCQFIIRFGYGIDELPALANWLEQAKRLRSVDAKSAADVISMVESTETPDEYLKELRRVRLAVVEGWRDIETEFLPERSKYRASV